MATTDEADRVLVLNPESGSGDHGETVRGLATEHGFVVRESTRAGEAAAIAAHAVAQGADLVAAAGGDGTINEVVLGLHRGDALEEVTLAIVPCGTGNDFASNLGVEGVEHAFELVEYGDRRRLDVGIASEADGSERRPFVNSCVAGITAEASEQTDSEAKERFGQVAYAISAARALAEFEGIRLHVDPLPGGDPWTGEAAIVFVGNARGIPGRGRARAQANVEDGLFEVAIVEDQPATKLVGDAAAERLFSRAADSVDRMLAPALEVRILEGQARPFSLDGEIVETDHLSLATRSGCLETVVGETYEPEPDRELGE